MRVGYSDGGAVGWLGSNDGELVDGSEVGC